MALGVCGSGGMNLECEPSAGLDALTHIFAELVDESNILRRLGFGPLRFVSGSGGTRRFLHKVLMDEGC